MPETTASALPAVPGEPAWVKPTAGTMGRRSLRTLAQALFALTKPRIIELLLVTTIPTMLLAVVSGTI